MHNDMNLINNKQLITNSDDKISDMIKNYLISKGCYKAAREFESEIRQSTNVPSSETLGSEIMVRCSAEINRKDLTTVEFCKKEYDLYRNWAFHSLDSVKEELLLISFPLFVHSYIKMIRLKFPEEAAKFLKNYRINHESFFYQELMELSLLTSPLQLETMTDFLIGSFIYQSIHSKFQVKISKFAYQLLVSFLAQSKFISISTMINNYLVIESIPNMNESKHSVHRIIQLLGYQKGMTSQFQSADQHLLLPKAVAFGVPGRLLPTIRISNQIHHPVYEQNSTVMSQPTADPSSKADPPAINIVEMPNTSDDKTFYKPFLDLIVTPQLISLNMKQNKRMKIESDGKSNGTMDDHGDSSNKSSVLVHRHNKKEHQAKGNSQSPSIIFATITNSYEQMNCMDINDQVTQLAAGFKDNVVRVWKLNQHSTSTNHVSIGNDMEIGGLLKDGNGEWMFKDVLPQTKHSFEQSMRAKMAHDRKSSSSSVSPTSIQFFGHSKPIYGIHQHPLNNRYILSGSADETIRLWDLHVSQCLYRYTCLSPVWDVKFSPFGYFFAAAMEDKSLCLYATDRGAPIRMMTGHYSDVNCVQWHDNNSLLVTGSDDKSVRVWDIRNGNCVRTVLTNSPVSCVAVSPFGHLIAGGMDDGTIAVWDITASKMLAVLEGHEVGSSINSLSFSYDNKSLMSGGSDCSVRIWGMDEVNETIVANRIQTEKNKSFANEKKDESIKNAAALDIKSPPKTMEPLHSYFSKFSPIYYVKYNEQNWAISGGPFSLSSATENKSHQSIYTDNPNEKKLDPSSLISNVIQDEQETLSTLGLAKAVHSSS